MAFIQGHQLGRLLVQNLWKVIGAFGLGVVAVLGGSLLLSDVRRAPQATASPSHILDVSNPSSQNSSERDKQSLPQGTDAVAPASDKSDQNSPTRPIRRKHSPASTAARLPNENRDSLAISPPPLPPSADTFSAPAVAQFTTPPASAAMLRLATETPITVRLTEQVSSKDSHKGEVFRGTLALPLTANGVVVAHSGAAVTGRVVDARSARIFRGGSYLNLELTQVEGADGHPLQIKTVQWYETGSHSRVVNAAILPNEAAKKGVSGVISGIKADDDNGSNHPERSMKAESPDAGEKTEKKKSTLTLPPGSEIVFRLAEPLTLTKSPEWH
jgi:hypothetical protein